MSPSERLFFEKLKSVVGDRYDIYPQVNLDKIFNVRYQGNWCIKKIAKSMIDRKSIDFLITIKETQSPFIGIELDDNPPKIQLSVDLACLKEGLDKANLKISVETARDERLTKATEPKLLLSYDDSDYNDLDYNDLSKGIKTNSIYTVQVNYNGGDTIDSIEEGIRDCLIESLCKFVLNDTNLPSTELNKE